MMEPRFNLYLFADAGTVTNVTTGTVNAYTGAASTSTAMSPTMKTYYDTELLENTREQLHFAQFGRKQTLPANHGKTVEWRKWNTLPDADQLTEGVIPTGKKLGMTYDTVTITQWGQYVTVSDVLDLHAIDDVILGATEELGAATGKTYEKLIRQVLMGGTNKMMAPAADGTANADRAALKAALATKECNFTPDMVNRAVTQLKKLNAPAYSGGKYVAIIHPSCTYDLRKSEDWLEAHKYARPEEIFNGEIGELHGVRFVESTMAPVIKGASDSKAIYQTMFFGKDAFAVVDPAGAGMETIIKSRDQVGGPLNQFSTIGNKFSMAAKILYQDRMVIVESGSSYSAVDEDNTAIVSTQA